jgi:hypothetical protein
LPLPVKWKYAGLTERGEIDTRRSAQDCFGNFRSEKSIPNESACIGGRNSSLPCDLSNRADFARERPSCPLFERKGVSFVSVTQQFNTTTSMGRLMLNVLLSFAQFEREVTGERFRDKIAASKKKGMWMGGTPPIGYVANGRRLEVVHEQAATVRHIFRRYTELDCITLLAREPARDGIRTRP